MFQQQLTNIDEKKIDILLNDYNLISDKIEQFLGTQFEILNVIFLIIGGFVAFILTYKDDDVKKYITLLPFVVFSVLSLFGYHYHRVMVLQGYKKYLEHKLNSSLEEELIFYSHIGMEYMGNTNKFAIYNTACYLISYLFSVFLVFYIHKKMTCYWKITLSLMYIVLLVAYCYAALPMINDTNKVKKQSIFINSNGQIIDYIKMDSLIQKRKQNTNEQKEENSK